MLTLVGISDISDEQAHETTNEMVRLGSYIMECDMECLSLMWGDNVSVYDKVKSCKPCLCTKEEEK